MGRYIEKADIEAVFGADNVATWSNLDNTQASADEARIAAAIAVAESAVDDCFRGGPYAIPFAPVPASVKDWSTRLAGAWLREARGDGGKETLDLRQRVAGEMALYLSFQRRLDAQLAAGGPTAPSVVE